MTAKIRTNYIQPLLGDTFTTEVLCEGSNIVCICVYRIDDRQVYKYQQAIAFVCEGWSYCSKIWPLVARSTYLDLEAYRLAVDDDKELRYTLAGLAKLNLDL